MNYFKNYVNHMLRFYARYHDKKDISDFKEKEADLKTGLLLRQFWTVCRKKIEML